MTRLLAVSHTGLASGAERVMVRALRAAVEDGWQVACLSPEGPLATDLKSVGALPLSFPDLMLPGGPRPIAMARLLARWVGAAIRVQRSSAQADVVVVNGLAALPALRLSRPSCPVVWLVHDVVVRRDRRALLRWCSGAVDLAVCVSQSVAEAIAPFGMATTVVHNGTPWPTDPVPAEPPSPPVVGCNAVLTPWKGQHVLLDAIARMPHPDLTVELMGGRFPKDADYVHMLETRAARPDLAGRVRFLGHVTDPIARMRSWTVAVSASTDPEAGPLSLIEAMSIGLPAVATAHGGALEIMGDNGLLVPPGDPDALAGALEQVLDDPARGRGVEAPSRLAVALHFNLDGQLRLLLDTLATLALGRRG
ncbi:MAG: glycosyltransferase family 4 protein [Actinobacteria bacterium]|nr:glycosyltransferase family 4 protein [Actinomycetota bacterium]